MKLTIDPEADALYLTLKEGKVSRTEKLADGLIVDLNETGALLGIELLWLSDRVAPETLANLNIELPLVKK
ncbi:MAG: DUF2283 domain-containing protein [Dehalococcoidia bacterium]|nr:DUF2283 domain-containing protein [Dehalococcoidia bacterium]